MKRDDDQELWDLLGQAPAPVPSPFFARNVLRQLRQEVPAGGRFSRWLRLRVLAPVSALALVSLVGGVSLYRHAMVGADNPPAQVAAVDPQDYEVVADLDDLLAMDDDNLWDDSSPL